MGLITDFSYAATCQFCIICCFLARERESACVSILVSTFQTSLVPPPHLYAYNFTLCLWAKHVFNSPSNMISVER